MEQRVNGLEIEYALTFDAGASMNLNRSAIYQHMQDAILRQYPALKVDAYARTRQPHDVQIEIVDGYFIENGSRFYYDMGHIEWATPEATSAQQTVLYDLASMHVLTDAARAANPPRGGRVLLTKNNIDYRDMQTFGCHENYQIMRRLGKRTDEQTFNEYVQKLTPFLVSRQLYAGAGKIGCADPQRGRDIGFQLSQRADFMTAVASNDTRGERGMIDMRDEPLSDAALYRRLHMIVGDSNMSHVAALLKIGTTLIVLRLIEAEALNDAPELRDPIGAIRTVAADIELRQTLPLINGAAITALELQRYYLARAQTYFSMRTPDPETDEILRLWAAMLHDLEGGAAAVADRVDWAAKYVYLMQPLIDAAGTDWRSAAAWGYILHGLGMENFTGDSLGEAQLFTHQYTLSAHQLNRADYAAQRTLYFDLRARDLRYHDIDPARSLYGVLVEEGLMHAHYSDADIGARLKTPPPTRALLRQQVIAWAYANGHSASTTMDWARIDAPTMRHSIELSDPLATDDAAVAALIAGEPIPDDVPINILNSDKAGGLFGGLFKRKPGNRG